MEVVVVGEAVRGLAGGAAGDGGEGGEAVTGVGSVRVQQGAGVEGGPLVSVIIVLVLTLEQERKVTKHLLVLYSREQRY